MEKKSSNFSIEGVAAILMSLAALITAWSAYQANLWTGQQSYQFARAIESQTVLTKQTLADNEHKMMDGIIALEIAKEVARGSKDVYGFLLPRIREEFRIPLQEWIALDPVNNAKAPAHPLLMPQYVEKVAKPAAANREVLQKTVHAHMKEARVSGSTSDGYVLLTVLFAAVLFFAGIAPTFHSFRLAVALLGISGFVLVVALAKLSTLSVVF